MQAVIKEMNAKNLNCYDLCDVTYDLHKVKLKSP